MNGKVTKSVVAVVTASLICISMIAGTTLFRAGDGVQLTDPNTADKNVTVEKDKETIVPDMDDIIITDTSDEGKTNQATDVKIPVNVQNTSNPEKPKKDKADKGNSTGNSQNNTSDNNPGATVPETSVTESIAGIVSSDSTLTQAVTMTSEEGVQAIVPAGVKVKEGATSLELTVTEKENSDSDVNLEATEKLDAYDVHIEGIAQDNTTPVAINLGEVLTPGLNKGNLSLYHVENGQTVKMDEVGSTEDFSEHNQFAYNPENGSLAVAMKGFSEVAVVSEEPKWEGGFDYSWYTNAVAAQDSEAVTEYVIANADQLAAFGAIVGGMAEGIERDSFAGKTVKLICDINLGYGIEGHTYSIFYPIGYYNSTGSYEKVSGSIVTSTVYSFEGVFDGNGHTISNFYQNTWEMFGDDPHYAAGNNYYNDAMGLFGYVVNGKVCNLTVDNFSSDGEFTPTGVIAAYAVNSTFENIAITNCNPRVYNTGNGGIVGIGGNSDDPDTYELTFTNITIDNTNKISALWGSWDVACGGLVGMFRGAGHVNMTNCHVAAQIDVFNDVCGNYQYYWYRYAGMMVGTNHNMKTDANGYTVPETEKFHAEGCTVHFGEWNNYWYCELVANSLASYTHDHQFSRLDQVDSVDTANMTVTVDGKITAIPKSGRANYVVVNGEPSTENAICYHFVDGAVWNHKDAGTETVNGVEGVLKEDKQHVYLPFNQLFTGYGWGVKHIPVYNGEDYAFKGITILDREVADSVVKFEAILKDTYKGKNHYANSVEVKVSELFKAAAIADEKLTIKGDQVQVTVSPVGDDSTVGAVYTANTDDWTQGTVVFSGEGAATVTISDYYFCKPTPSNITIVNPEPEEKFDLVFENTDKYIYRVGSAPNSPVYLNTLFEDDGDNVIAVNGKAVDVSIETVAGNSTGTYTTDTSDWTKGKIQFSGTGVVKVTITDDYYCIPTELYLEVVDATNVTTYSELKNQNSVLLNDIIMTDNSAFYLSGATLYGNGFSFDCKNARVTGSGSVSENYVIGLTSAHLDNVEIVGKVYTDYGAQASNNYNRALIVSRGNSSITNSYLSNTASPIRLIEGNLEVKGTTLKGGNFANIDVRNGHLTVEDVTTINQALNNDKADNGTTVVGLGIVVYYENVDAALTSITVKGTLKQYNHISENDDFSNDYAQQFVNAMFGDNFNDVQTKADGIKWVNTCIVSMSDGIKVTIPDSCGYVDKEAGFLGKTGAVYTKLPTTESITESSPNYSTEGQGAIAPSYSFDYTTKNYIAKADGYNDYCYYDNGKVLIAMDEGDTFEWDPFILTVTKNGNIFGYAVKIGNTTYSEGEKIAFSTSGDYIVEYTYMDSDNYTVDESGNIITKEKLYTQTVDISVSVIQPSAQHAKFTFANTNTATEKITVNDKTYISAVGVSETDKKWGYITVNGTKIFYPITEAQMKTSSNLLGSKETQVYYYVFKDAVTITDYKDGGTGGEQIYNDSTTSMPSNLSVVNGMEAKYTAISSACVDISKLTKKGSDGEVWDFSASTTVSGTTTYNGFLAHSSPSGLAVKTNSRDYDAITVAQFSYTDAAGATYYYFVGYFMPNQIDVSTGGGCVTPDTLVTLADGSKKRIDEVEYTDSLLVWDFYTGEYAEVPAIIIFNMGTDNYEILSLTFEDGTVVKTISGHRFFNADENRYVLINSANVDEFIGSSFIKMDGETPTAVKLTGYSVSEEYTTSYSIMSSCHYNFIVEGMLSDTFHKADAPLFEYFDFSDNMKFDEAKMQADIDKYGLYTYEEFADVLTEEQFNAFNVKYMKVSVGKGNATYQQILDLINEYVASPAAACLMLDELTQIPAYDGETLGGTTEKSEDDSDIEESEEPSVPEETEEPEEVVDSEATDSEVTE